MKSLAIFALLVFISSSATAETVGGFTIGETFKHHQSLKAQRMDSLGDLVYEVADVPFFDMAQVETDLNYKVVAVTFQKSYTYNVHSLSSRKREIRSDFEKIKAAVKRDSENSIRVPPKTFSAGEERPIRSSWESLMRSRSMKRPDLPC